MNPQLPNSQVKHLPLGQSAAFQPWDMDRKTLDYKTGIAIPALSDLRHRVSNCRAMKSPGDRLVSWPHPRGADSVESGGAWGSALFSNTPGEASGGGSLPV